MIKGGTKNSFITTIILLRTPGEPKTGFGKISSTYEYAESLIKLVVFIHSALHSA
jgi:hypothetical protein